MASSGTPSGKYSAVYSAIEEYNYRHAMKLLEKRELSSTTLGKALRSVVLVRSGARDEALELAAEVLRSKPSDVNVVSALAEVFRRTDEMGYYIQLHDTAAAEKPDDVQLGRLLCYAWARVEEYKKLQASALRLAKLTGKPEYSAWAALALHAQVAPLPRAPAPPSQGPTPGSPSLTARDLTGGGRGWCAGPPDVADKAGAAALKMAELLLGRSLDNTPPDHRDGETVGLWVHTLVRQGRAAEALAALSAQPPQDGVGAGGGGGKYSFVAPATGSGSSEESGGSSSLGGDGDATGAGASASPRRTTFIPLAERAPEEDVPVAADGLDGRGTFPGPLQAVDAARYIAYLHTEAAREAGDRAAAGGDASATLAALWSSAEQSYARLLTTFDAEDLSYHQGYVYASSRAACVTIGSLLEVRVQGAGPDAAVDDAVASACAPLEPLCPTGHPALDAILAPVLATLTSASGSAPPEDDGALPPRGVALGLLRLVAARAELLSRVSGTGYASATAEGLLSRLHAQLGSLLAGYVATIGAKPCCFLDLQEFLPMLLPPLPAGHSTVVSSPTHALLSFLSPEARILSMPYCPKSGTGCGSDTAPGDEMFHWSSSLPQEAAAPLLGMLSAWRTKYAPTPAMAAELGQLAAAARNAAVAAAGSGKTAAHNKEATGDNNKGASSKKDKKKAEKKGGKGGSKAASAFSLQESDDEEGEGTVMSPKRGGGFPAGDPHGVADALSPASALLYTPEAKERLRLIRSSIRRYCSAVQLQRYLGTLRGSACDASVVDALVGAWSHTLPLLTLAPGGLGESRDVGEGDDLLLLAVHLLWERGLTALRTAPGAQEGEWQTPLPALLAARAAFWEALLLLQAGSASSPWNPHFRLASARTYGWLGAVAGTFQEWRSLRVKHVQLDTLSWVAAPHVARLSWLGVQKDMAEELAVFHRNAAREVPDFIKVALRTGTFSQALDNARMRLRLRESATAAVSRSGYAHLGLIFNTSRGPSDVHAHLQRCLVTGEVPDAWMDASPSALSRLRDNDERDQASWDAPSQALRIEGMHGPGPVLSTATASAEDAPSTSGAAGAGAGVEALPLAVALLRSAAASSSSSSFSSPFGLFNATCSYGGTAERALRAAARNRLLRLRGAVQHVLLAVTDGVLDRAGTHMEVVRALLSEHPIHASTSATTAAAPSAPHDALPSALLRSLCLDLASPALAVVDTGISGPRHAVQRECGRAVVLSLQAALDAALAVQQHGHAHPGHGSAEAGSGGGGGEAGGGGGAVVGLQRARGHLASLTACIEAVASDIGCHLRYPATTADDDSSGSSLALNAASLAEATLFAQYALVYVVAALGVACRVASGALAKAREKGMAAAKGGSSSGAPAGGWKEWAGELEAACSSLSATASGCAKAVGGLHKAVRSLAGTLDGSISDATVLACVVGGLPTLPSQGGSASISFATSLARDALARWVAATTGATPAPPAGPSSTKKAAAAVVAAAAAASTSEGGGAAAVPGCVPHPPAPSSQAGDAGASFVASANETWAAALAGGIRCAVEGVGASFTGTATGLQDELEDRVQALKACAASAGAAAGTGKQ